MATYRAEACRHVCDNEPCGLRVVTEASVPPDGWTTVAGVGLPSQLTFHDDDCVLQWVARLRVHTRDDGVTFGRQLSASITSVAP